MLQENNYREFKAAKFCTCVVLLQKKCKQGISPGLVQQRCSELINKKTDNCLAVLLMYVPICRLTPAQPSPASPHLSSDKAGEIVFPETDLPRHLPAEATQPNLRRDLRGT